MPEPQDGEERDEFVSRCIPIVLEDGTAEDQDQAVAICNSLWEEAKKSEKPMKVVAVKAVGDWELDVLAVPYGGPHGGKDSDGEYFSPDTNLYLDKFDKPIVSYYHGFDPEGNPQGEPEEIGEVLSIEKKSDGVWARVKLDKLSKLAKRIWEAAKDGLARASSGTIQHIMRVARDGLITHWPFVELALIDTDGSRQPANAYAVAMPVMKAAYKQAGKDWPDIPDTETTRAAAEGLRHSANAERDGKGKILKVKGLKMEKEELLEILDERDTKKAEADAAKAKKEEEHEAEIKAAEEAAVEKAKKEWEEKAAKGNRLPSDKGDDDITGKNVTISKFGELRKYDNLDAGDHALLIGVLDNAHKENISKKGVSDSALKALAVKLSEDKTMVGNMGMKALRAGGPAFKADEVMQQDLTSYGDEWVGEAYSQALWEAIRAGTFVAANLPSIEVPAGYESIYLPIESTDPTWYKVAETEDHNATTLFPDATVTSSKVKTGRVQLTLAKMGCRVPWSGELEEDSLIPFVAQLRKQIQVSGAEQLEHAVIDGDNNASATANINDIGGTPAATDLYMMFDGFRVSPLVTTSANSRSGGVLDETDFLETLKLMGTAGLNGADVNKVAFIQDANVRWKSLEIATVQSRDVFGSPTIENGVLNSIWGYKVHTSYQMHRVTSDRKANTSGKCDVTTTTNNTTGSLLAVRWDQWKLGYRRRMTIETTRYPRSDSSEIVALMRLGLIQRDTEASAITYNITV